MSETIKILAVDDPAVHGYVNDSGNVFASFQNQVELEVISWDRYYDTLLNALKGVTQYDIVMIAGHLWKRDFVESGYLALVSLEKADLFPTMYREMCIGKEAYLSPSFCDGHMIVYRKSVLKQVLGAYPSAVITPEDYILMARKLHEHGHQIVMKAHASEIFTDALPFLRMYGQDIYDEQQQIQCDTDLCMEGLKQYCSLKQYACMDTEQYGNDEVAEALKSGKAVMGITWSGQLGVVCDNDCVDKEDLGFSTLSTAWNVTWSFAVCAASPNQEAANEVLSYLRTPEIDKIAGKASGAPIRLSTYAAEEHKYPWFPCQQQMIAQAKTLPDLRCAGDKNAVLYEKIAEAFAGRLTPQKAMKEAAAMIRTIHSKRE